MWLVPYLYKINGMWNKNEIIKKQVERMCAL